MQSQEKELKYTIKIVGQTGDADRVLEQTAKKADAIAAAATRAKAQLSSLQNTGNPGGGSQGGGAGGGGFGVYNPWMQSGVGGGFGGGGWQPNAPPPLGQFPALPLPEQKAEKAGAGALPVLKGQSVGAQAAGQRAYDATSGSVEEKAAAANKAAKEQAEKEKGIVDRGRELQKTFLRLAGTVTATVGSVIALGKANNAYADMINGHMMQSGSDRQRYNKVLDPIPILGGAAKSISGSYADKRERGVMGDEAYYKAMDKSAMHQFSMASRDIYSRFHSDNQARADAFGSEMYRYDAQADYAGIEAGNMFAPDKGTRGRPGQQRFDDNAAYDAQIRGAVGSQNRAIMEQMAAGSRASDSIATNAGFNAADAAYKRGAKRTMGDALHAVNNWGDWFSTDASAKIADAELQNANYMDSLTQRKARLEGIYSDRKDAINRQGAVDDATLGVKQSRLGVINAKIGTNESSQVEFATSDWQHQQMLLEAARSAKAKGFDSLAPEQKQALLGSSATSEWARDLAKADGEKNGTLKEIWGITGQKDTQTLKDEKSKLETEIEVEYVLNKQKLRKMMKELTDEMKKALDEVGIDIKDAQLNKVTIEKAKARISAGQS